MNNKCHSQVWCGTVPAVCAAICVAFVSSVFADSAADAIMFKNPKRVSAPSHSFLEEVVPVKESKPAEAKPKVEPVKVAEPVKVEPVKAEPVKTEPVKAEPVKAEPAVVEPVKVEPVKDEPVKVEPVKAEPATVEPVVTVEKQAAKADDEAEKAAKKKAKEESKSKQPARDAIITADRTDYDRKEGIILFDRNVHVDDEQYKMHADRLFLFLEGTNELKRLVAIGHVAITNEDKRAYCAKATFSKKQGRVVMYSSDEITAQLHEEGKKGSDVKGEKITFWLDSEQVEVENPVITMPGGFGGQGGMKKLIGK